MSIDALSKPLLPQPSERDVETPEKTAALLGRLIRRLEEGRREEQEVIAGLLARIEALENP